VLPCVAKLARGPPDNHAIGRARFAAQIPNIVPDLSVASVTLSDH
jgi:hypothetical protein